MQIHKQKGQTLGLVPTMGYLHGGHEGLLETSAKHTDITVCSIFVNPTQFSNAEDLVNYPQSIEEDLKMLERLGCEYVFYPSTEEMYPSTPDVSLKFENFGQLLEGKWRPGHFNGVGLVVAKLINIIQPDIAFFGEKDLQQLMLVKRMVSDLNMNVSIIGVPTVREESGLALSSRNTRLNNKEKEQASFIFKALSKARKILEETTNIDLAKKEALEVLKKVPEIKTEYLEIVNPESFEIITTYGSSPAAICISVQIGKVRLIDNIVIGQ